VIETPEVIDAVDAGPADDRPGRSAPASSTARRTAIAVGVVVAALIAVLAWGGGEEVESQSPLVGNRVPSVVGTDLDGTDYDIDDRRGSWVVVNFFATWCPPCVAEHPELLAVADWGRARGDVEVLSVVFNEPDPEPVRQFFAQRGGDWPVIYGAPSVPIDFQVAQIPETFIVTPGGQVVAHLPGEVTAEEVTGVITAVEERFDEGGS
jgi:cytochrome c biogenesis protein CcmG/thiol:disulfide interchange protein DsbE